MPVEYDPVFDTPEPEAVLWRYMSFAKFADLVLSRKLWFARPNELGDDFEAKYTGADFKALAGGAAPPRRPAAGPLSYRTPTPEDLERLSGNVGQWAAVSCWYAGMTESFGMWQFYGAGEAVAIQTTVARVQQALRPESNPVYIGRVRYVDFDATTTDLSNALYPLLQKRPYYSTEQEVRLVLLPQDWTVQTQSAAGRHAKVQLDRLVEKVVIGPKLGSWFRDLVSRMLEQQGLTCAVEFSRLDDRPGR